MASPQLKNGYTPIANEILERISEMSVSGGAMRVLMVIIRKTYGFHKKRDAIALSQFVKATKYGTRNVIYILQELEAKGIIKVERNQRRGKMPNVYAFNKNYDTWSVDETAPQVERNRKRSKLRNRKIRGVHKPVEKNVERKKGSANVLHIQKILQKKETKERNSEKSSIELEGSIQESGMVPIGQILMAKFRRK